MRARLGVAVVVSIAAAALAAATATPADASRYMRVGIYDEAQTLYGPIPETFSLLNQLHVQEIRENLYWGGPYGVAQHRPANPRDPDDPAYHWTLYDRTVAYAQQYGIHVLFSVYGTPTWASGRQRRTSPRRTPIDLRNFAYAAAKRYSGTFTGDDGEIIPAVKRVDGLERAEQPDVPVAAVQAYRRRLRDPERDRLREDLQRGLRRRARGARLR